MEISSDVLYRFNIGINGLINLTGGIPSSEIKDLSLIVEYDTDEAIKLEVVTTLYTVSRIIDFEKKVINNAGMVVTKQGQGIGTNLFLNQVEEARAKGFNKLTVFAKGKDALGEWNGSYRWGRVGYKMNIEDHNEFLDLMKRLKRNEKDLGELLLSKDGCQLWELVNFF